MTTAEPPEPLFFQHSEYITSKQILHLIDGPTARHLYYYRSFSCFFAKIFLNGHELSHDILCISRSDDNRRTAGAVDFSVFRVHYV